MTKISDDIVKEIDGLLYQHRSGLWNSHECALVDEGCQLLVVVTLTDHGRLYDKTNPVVEIPAPPKQQLELINKILFDILDPRLPRRQGDYSWMACIHVEKQVDAIMGGMQTSES